MTPSPMLEISSGKALGASSEDALRWGDIRILYRKELIPVHGGLLMDTGRIPRYLGPRLPSRQFPSREHLGIRFLALRIMENQHCALTIVRALDSAHTHRDIESHYAHELAFYQAHMGMSIVCIGGGRMSLGGGDVDLFDGSSTFGAFSEHVEEICSTLRDAMTRGEFEERAIKYWPNYFPSRFDELQKKFSARHIAGIRQKDPPRQ